MSKLIKNMGMFSILTLIGGLVAYLYSSDTRHWFQTYMLWHTNWIHWVACATLCVGAILLFISVAKHDQVAISQQNVPKWVLWAYDSGILFVFCGTVYFGVLVFLVHLPPHISFGSLKTLPGKTVGVVGGSLIVISLVYFFRSNEEKKQGKWLFLLLLFVCATAGSFVYLPYVFRKGSDADVLADAKIDSLNHSQAEEIADGQGDSITVAPQDLDNQRVTVDSVANKKLIVDAVVCAETMNLVDSFKNLVMDLRNKNDQLSGTATTSNKVVAEKLAAFTEQVKKFNAQAKKDLRILAATTPAPPVKELQQPDEKVSGATTSKGTKRNATYRKGTKQGGAVTHSDVVANVEKGIQRARQRN